MPVCERDALSAKIAEMRGLQRSMIAAEEAMSDSPRGEGDLRYILWLEHECRVAGHERECGYCQTARSLSDLRADLARALTSP